MLEGNTARPADPEGVAGWFRTRLRSPRLIVHESGLLSIWLQRGLERLELPAACIDARKAHKGLSTRPDKSDAADAEGLARLTRTCGSRSPRGIGSAALLDQRACAVDRPPQGSRKPYSGYFQDLGHPSYGHREGSTGAGLSQPLGRCRRARSRVAHDLADGFISAYATLCRAVEDLDRSANARRRAIL